MKVVIEIEDGVLYDEAFKQFKSVIRHLSEEQCQKALRVLVLGQPAEDAEQAMLARIADYIAFGEKYSNMPRDEAVEKFKEQLTTLNLRCAWENSEF